MYCMHCVCVPVMRVQNVAGLLVLFIVAVCSYPQPPLQPLNISTQKPGTLKIVSYIHVHDWEGVYTVFVY
jgi:hypothetical protein